MRGALAGVDEAEVDDSVRCLTCDQHAQLHAVLHMFADNHVHRVLTPTDILRWLVTHGPAAATPPGTPSLAPTPAPTPMAMV
ncbi:hypothetical protein QJQ45_029578 [Haematococcus lacustris]|nr:hypothetical protein QJQ45_029578 [Haematococcus lacustris]